MYFMLVFVKLYFHNLFLGSIHYLMSFQYFQLRYEFLITHVLPSQLFS